ncbi:MAG: hypothetical protein WBQ34_00075 [Candidatus Acidiferrales bacterium]
MAQSILVFDFGANEDAAQQAKHKVEAWKQGFRLGNKMLLKFEREESAAEQPAAEEVEAADDAESPKTAATSPKHGKKKSTAKAATKSGGKADAKAAEEPEHSETPASNGKVRLLLRLDFSDHEKLSHQRWLDRIPTEEPFKSASGETIRVGDPEFAKTAELFEALD